jgi:polyisoprenoid-binding protein YceI
MKTTSIKQIFFTICLSATVVAVSAQSPVLVGKESLVKISGTSNLHDWHEIAEDFTIEMSLTADGSASPAINKVILTCKAASIMSDNSIMTNKTHEALRVDNHPEITFNSAQESALQVRNGGFSSTITGQLTINGIKNQVTVPVEGTLTGTKLRVKGAKTIKMSDYGIKAPTALMGTLKTGDEVTVSFDLKFEVPSNNIIITALNN